MQHKASIFAKIMNDLHHPFPFQRSSCQCQRSHLRLYIESFLALMSQTDPVLMALTRGKTYEIVIDTRKVKKCKYVHGP